MKPPAAPYARSVRRLVVLLAVVLVNLPAVHQAWTAHRVAADGEDVEAVVVHARTVSGRHLVDYRLPEDVDPVGNRFSASLDEASYERARESRRLAVRVLPGHPGANRPEGEVSSPVLVVAAVGADLVLLVVGGAWLYRRRHGSWAPPVSG